MDDIRRHPIDGLMAARPGGYSARMPTLDDLVDQLRLNATTDVQFAQRVALVCCHLATAKADPAAAIRAMFQIEQRNSKWTQEIWQR